MFSLVTKAIPALIANFGILVAAIPGWVAGLTVLKVAIIALKAALVLGGIALAALIGFKIGKWAVENFAWVDSISTGLAKLVIQLTKVINLIPGVNIGGIGSFKKSDDPNFGRSENIGSIMDRKKARASSSALLPADTTLPPNVATPKVATPTLKSSGSVFEDISFSNLKNPLKFIPPEKMEGTMGMLKKAPMLKHRLSGVDQKTSLDAYFNANPIPSGSLRLPGVPQSNRGAPQSNRGITDGEIKLLEQLKIMTAAIEAQPQIQNQLQDVY